MPNINPTSKAARKGFYSLNNESEVFFPEKKPPLSELEEEHDSVHELAELANLHEEQQPQPEV